MEIKHIESSRGGKFVIEESGNRAAEMAYTNAGENLIIIDTRLSKAICAAKESPKIYLRKA